MAGDRERVVVTGIGLVTPIGTGRAAVWESAMAGRSGTVSISRFDTSGHLCRIAAEVPDFVAEDHMDRKAARRMDRVSQLAVAAGRLGLEDAGLTRADLGDRAGAMIATGAGGNESFEEGFATMLEKGPQRMSPLTLPACIVSMSAGQVSMELGLGGPLGCPVTACASGNHAIGDAFATIRRGAADIMLAGGSEAGVTPFCMAALDATRALSRRNDDPATASRPFDIDRDGFVAAEGAGVLVLESARHAEARGAEPICEIAGYGLSGDAHHLTEPDPTGRGQMGAMSMALADAGLDPEEIDYINAHGTGTPTGDGVEIMGIRGVLGEAHAARTAVSSTKSMHGHGMGAAGGMEAGLTAIAILEGTVPPTINLSNIDPECAGVEHVAGTPLRRTIRAALSNSFGFGGHNAVIAFRAVDR